MDKQKLDDWITREDDTFWDDIDSYPFDVEESKSTQKIHLIGELNTICGIERDSVQCVYRIRDGATCKSCIRCAKDFQRR